MKAHRAVSLLAGSLLLTCVACDKSGSSSTATTSASATPPASASAPAPAESAPKRGGRINGGPGTAVFQAARNASDLKEPQRATLEKLVDGLKEENPSKTELQDLRNDLQAQTKAGKIEMAKLEPRIVAIEKVMQTRLDKEADALNQLHAALEPAQRKAIATEARAKQATMEEKIGAAMKEPAKDDPKEHAKAKVEALTKDLDLDAAQQKKLEASLVKEPFKATAEARAEMKKNSEALLAEFEKDTFDAKKLDAFTQSTKRMRAAVTRDVEHSSHVLAVLKPEQREKYSTKMDSPSLMGLRFGAGPGSFRGHPGGPMMPPGMGDVPPTQAPPP